MIECSNDYIWYKKRRKKNPKRIIAFFLILSIVLGAFIFYKTVVTKRVFIICSEYASSYSALSSNKAVFSVLDANLSYNDLINVEKNSAGEIVLMSANSYKINLLSREIVEQTSNYLNKELSDGVPIPLLSFLGFDVLKGYGRQVNYKSLFVSTVECEFDSQFVSAGINQTIHKIYVNVICTVNMQLLTAQNSQNIITPVLISETILIGKVPEIYLSGKLFGLS